MRYVIYHEEWGVYLGSALGFGFWSKVDPVDQPGAVTFQDEETIHCVMASWDGGDPGGWRTVPVPDVEYATVAQCIDAGLPGWDYTDLDGVFHGFS